MHNRPILRVPPGPRPLSAVTETGTQTWTVSAGVSEVAFPPRGAPGGTCACADGYARMRAAEVTATPPVTAGTVRQANDGPAGTGNSAGSSGGSAAVTGPAGDGGAGDARTPASSRTYPLADRMPAVGAGGGAGALPGPRPADPGGNADPPRQAGRVALDGGATPGGGAGRGARSAGHRYVHARFGGVPVLLAPELAAQIRAAREEQP